MGYNTDFWLNVYDTEHQLEYEEWQEIIENIEFDDSDSWQKEFLISIYGDSEKARWHEHEQDMISLTKKIPHLVITLYGKGDDLSDEWEKTFSGGHLIKNKHITDGNYMAKWLKRDHPAMYYRYMSTRCNESKAQNDYYKFKGFHRGFEIVRKMMINNAALKIQSAWDRYWYQPNPEGQSRAAIKGYANVVANQPPIINQTMTTSKMLPILSKREIKLPAIVRYATRLKLRG